MCVEGILGAVCNQGSLILVCEPPHGNLFSPTEVVEARMCVEGILGAVCNQDSLILVCGPPHGNLLTICSPTEVASPSTHILASTAIKTL